MVGLYASERALAESSGVEKRQFLVRGSGRQAGSERDYVEKIKLFPDVMFIPVDTGEIIHFAFLGCVVFCISGPFSTWKLRVKSFQSFNFCHAAQKGKYE